MRRLLLRATVAVAVLSFSVAPLLADVTIKYTVDGKVMGFSGKGTSTTYIKGHKMRVETVNGDRTQIMILDVDAQKMYMVDPKKKQVDEWDMATFAAQIEKSVDVQNAKGSIKPNGQTKQVGGNAAAGYDMTMSMKAALGGGKDLNMTVTMQGPAWIVKGAPGSADFSRFYKAAADKGFIFGDPNAAKAQPGQAKALAEMYRQFADIGGIPYETEMDIKMSGEGPMAIVAKMGNAHMTQIVQSVETGALADDLFAPPAGFKVNIKK